MVSEVNPRRAWFGRGVWSHPSMESGRLVDSLSALRVGSLYAKEQYKIGNGNSQSSEPRTTVNYYCLCCWDGNIFKVLVSNLGIHKNRFQAIKNKD